MDPGQFKAMLVEQQQAFWERETGLERNCLAQVEQAASVPHVVIISGLRRVRIKQGLLLTNAGAPPTPMPAGTIETRSIAE